MARWATGANWAAGLAPGEQRDMPLGLSLSEGLGSARACFELLLQLEGEGTNRPGTLHAKTFAVQQYLDFAVVAACRRNASSIAVCINIVWYSGCMSFRAV